MGGINSQIAPEENTIIMRVQKTSVRLIVNATIPVSMEEEAVLNQHDDVEAAMDRLAALVAVLNM